MIADYLRKKQSQKKIWARKQAQPSNRDSCYANSNNDFLSRESFLNFGTSSILPFLYFRKSRRTDTIKVPVPIAQMRKYREQSPRGE